MSTNTRALIVGGTSGIGAEVAAQLATQGSDVTVIGRRKPATIASNQFKLISMIKVVSHR